MIVKEEDKQLYNINNFNYVDLKIGGESVVDFAPNINSSFKLKDSKEHFFININHTRLNAGSEVFENDKIKLTDGSTESIYEEADSERIKNLIIYNSDPRPSKGVDWVEEFELKHTPNLLFCKQPSTEQGFLDIEPNTILPIQNEILGSYAVYQKSLFGRALDKNKNEIYDASTGKLLHIYARRLYDSKSEIWIEPQIEAGEETSILRVTLPAGFLDNAVFPVTLNDTFGYDTIGGSTSTIDTGKIYAAGSGDPGSDGTLTSVDIYCSNTSATVDMKAGMYDDNTGPENLQGSETEHVNPGTFSAQWRAFSVSTGVSNGITYWFGVEVSESGVVTVYYDNIGTTVQYRDSKTYADAWPDPFVDDFDTIYELSFRGTFTPSGGGYANNVCGVASASIGKVNGVATADISKVNGV